MGFNLKVQSAISWVLFTSIIFIGVFSISEKISLPIFLFCVAVPIFFLKIKVFAEDSLIFLLLALMLIFSIGKITVSGILYITSFIIVIVVFTKIAGVSAKYLNFKKILYWLVLFVNIYIIYEFIARNFYPSLYFELPRARVQQINALFMGIFLRARGFAEEPGHMGLFYEFAFPILFIKIIPNLKKKSKIIFFVTTILAVFFMFSAFTITVLGAYVLMWGLFKLKIKRRIIGVIFIIVTSIILNSFFPFINNFVYTATESISRKVTYSEMSGSSADRLNRLESGFLILSNNSWGIGPMNMKYYSNYDSSLNLYLDFLVFFGPLTLLVFLIYLLIITYKAYRIGKWSYMASLILILGHYCIIANFWYPFLWVLIGLIQCIYYNPSIDSRWQNKIA